MNKTNNLVFFFFLGISFFISSCGRKNRTVFFFQAPSNKILKEHLVLPAIRNSRAFPFQGGVLLRWKAPLKKELFNLIGYSIYSVSHNGIIAKKPLNRQPIRDCEYLIHSQDIASGGYVLKGLFLIDNELLAGPTSRIIYCK